MIVFAHREQVGVRILGWVVVFDRVILEGNQVNYSEFVTGPSNKNSDGDVWYALAVIRLDFGSGDV